LGMSRDRQNAQDQHARHDEENGDERRSSFHGIFL